MYSGLQEPLWSPAQSVATLTYRIRMFGKQAVTPSITRRLESNSSIISNSTIIAFQSAHAGPDSTKEGLQNKMQSKQLFQA